MKTEIQGDFKGYVLRFKMPSRRSFTLPLKSAGFIFLLDIILSSILLLLGIPNLSFVLSVLLCMIAIGYYIGVLYKDFWNVVLEESRGLLADLIMWVYYILICTISLLPTFILVYCL